jgi:large subunit ribosomal protein L21
VRVKFFWRVDTLAAPVLSLYGNRSEKGPHVSGHAAETAKAVPEMARLAGGGACMYAIIETGGKQYKVQEGDILFIEKLSMAEGDAFAFDRVLAVSDEGILKTGNPTVGGVSVTAKVLAHGKGKKIIIYKYKAKKTERRKNGHRQPYTRVQIQTIQA